MYWDDGFASLQCERELPGGAEFRGAGAGASFLGSDRGDRARFLLGQNLFGAAIWRVSSADRMGAALRYSDRYSFARVDDGKYWRSPRTPKRNLEGDLPLL